MRDSKISGARLSDDTVGVYVDFSSEFGRQVFLGAAAYLRQYSTCKLKRITVLPKNKAERHGFPEKLIAHIISPQALDFIEKYGVRAVNVSGFLERLPIPSVRIDDVAVGKMIAQYFVRKCFRRFVFIGDPDHTYSRLRESGFRDGLKSFGHQLKESLTLQTLTEAIEARKADYQPTLADHSIAVACSNDRNAIKFLNICNDHGWQIPEQFAVVGVDNDLISNEIAEPPLSSVEVPGFTIGFEAAKRILNPQQTRGLHDLRIAPLRVWTRQSSDLLAVGDPEVATVLKQMQRRFHESVCVNDWLALVPLSRRTLEVRFRSATGRSMHEELMRIRLAHAKESLVSSNSSVEHVAERSGFGSSRQLSAAFRQHVGMSPSQWRRTFLH